MKMKFLLTWLLIITSLAAINAQSDSLSVSGYSISDGSNIITKKMILLK